VSTPGHPEARGPACILSPAPPGVIADRGPLLEVRGLSKAFGGLRAVDDLSFVVRAGEILGLLGPNGSGKTTVFNLIAGVFPPDGGRVYFAGREITRASPSSRAALGIARTFQLVRTLPSLSVLDNVVAARLYGREPAPSVPAARAEALGLLALVDLGDKAAVPARTLTLAERKTLEIARALASRPRLLLLDEPAAGLNPVEVDAALAFFGRIRAGGVTLVVVEHNVRAVRALCDRVLVLNAGRKIVEGRPAEALEHAEVIQVYLGRA
jgi:ABC-type branched-subunit amino acid transport system ATPase component